MKHLAISDLLPKNYILFSIKSITSLATISNLKEKNIIRIPWLFLYRKIYLPAL